MPAAADPVSPPSAAFPDDATIARLAEGFLARTLPKAAWTHAAHFATALWLMRERPDIVPERDMPDLIRAYNEAVGGVNSDTEGYHETITVASLRAARAHLAACPGEAPLHEVLAALLASPLGRSDWLFDYWTKARLFSVEARRAWVPPDLAPLPF